MQVLALVYTYIDFVESKSNDKQLNLFQNVLPSSPKLIIANHDYYDFITSLLVCTIFSIIYTYTWLCIAISIKCKCSEIYMIYLLSAMI